MEHLSKIELVGRVGTVHEQVIGKERLVRFSVGVETVYLGGAGSTVSMTWFNCVYRGNCDVEKGKDIHLDWKMRGQTYTGVDEQSRQFYEVKVNRIW